MPSLLPPRLAFGLLGAVLGLLGAVRPATAQPEPPSDDDSRQTHTVQIPGTLIEFEMVRVPGGTVTLETPDGPREVSVDPFWIGRTEVTWDAYDVYVYELDRDDSNPAVDAVARPSKPYVLPGEDFGHKGYPALAMTRRAAQTYARWLSARTGDSYRLPTEAEWLHACRLGFDGADRPERLDERAWHAANADGQTHPAGSSTPNRLGIYDMLGNVAEHVLPVEAEAESADTPVVLGGSYRSDPATLSCASRDRQTRAWNETDPQLPKSQWWLSDAPFVGFRVVKETPDP
mgnify:CR=1 FL=1